MVTLHNCNLWFLFIKCNKGVASIIFRFTSLKRVNHQNNLLFLKLVWPACIIKAFIGCHTLKGKNAFNDRVHGPSSDIETYIKEQHVETFDGIHVHKFEIKECNNRYRTKCETYNGWCC